MLTKMPGVHRSVRGRRSVTSLRTAAPAAFMLVASACGSSGPPQSAPATSPPSPPAASPSLAPTGGPTQALQSIRPRTSGNAIVFDWERLPNPFGPGVGGELNAVAAYGAGFVVVGSTFESPGEAVTITSPDGLTWSPPAPLPGGTEAYVDALAVGPDLMVAAGSSTGCCGQGGGRALVWTSRDGSSWEPVPDDPGFADAGISAVAAVGPGFVAVGIAHATEAGNDAAFWSSPDGWHWSRLGHVPGLATGWMQDVTASGSHIVAVGTRGNPNTGPSATWSSTDGRTWLLGPGGPALATGVMTTIVATTDGFVAFGGDPYGQPLVWRSTDGASWTLTGQFGKDDGGFADAVVVGDQLLALGQQNTPDDLTAGVLWQSSHVGEWTLVPTGPVFAGIGVARGALRAAVSSAPRIVVVGYAGSPEAAEPAIWVSPPGT